MIVLDWLKGLLGSKGSSQIGSRNRAVSGVTVGDNASVVAVGQDITINQGSSVGEESADVLDTLENQVSELFSEMREDLAKHPCAREFIILKTGSGYNPDPNKVTLVYYFDDHLDLRNKLRILENHGLIEEITFNNTERFVMTEALVGYLTAQIT